MPYQLKLKLTLPTVPAMPGAGLTKRIRDRFRNEAGQLIVNAIRDAILGFDATLDISDEWGQEKRTARNKRGLGFKFVAGKDWKQPLIWTGEGIYDNLEIIPQGGADGFIVMVSDRAGVDEGFDYAQYWEDATDYLGKGFDLVESQLDQLMLDIVFQEMAL